ncbi:MAG: aminomethyl-transferring glycine dehydrogenase subunit GcvPB [Chloroflexi bacterium]|nr:aminomethyl-transferring glycine dehydrogenase subunit GcvPB [Chloroflexota bacterium]MBI3764520.1 aminomethyl-transferring glycine dehydrogenase subunit GcvPB [Chloroflexota bacterium]
MTEPLIYDFTSPGRCGVTLPEPDVPLAEGLPSDLLRDADALDLPEVSQLDVVRHYLRLSQMNYAIDKGLYPLGSCTMKYNPRLNEDTARLPGFAGSHPLQDPNTVQGNLALMYELQDWLKEIGGFAGVSLQPAAGAHGEFTGILMMRAYHLDRGDTKRTKILIPNSAHGTNPASTTMSGLKVVELPSDARGNIDLEALRQACDDTVVGLMITNPNTLGLFEEHIEQVVKLVHDCGGLVYGDGANMNAMVGIARPGDLGFDVMHYNLHKTFSTPHGGGGPGSGPVGVSARLVDFLPDPVVDIVEEGRDDEPPLYGFVKPRKTIGRMKAFQGQFGMHVRAYTYMRVHGASGLRANSEMAVLNANYLLSKIRHAYHLPYDRVCKHEFVVEGHWADSTVHALDISKRLMDYNFHPPTNYFPLIVKEALMIEPTETESKETLDAFADALLQIADEAHRDPEVLKSAPHSAPISRLDEVSAARQLVLCCRPIPEWAES